MFGRVKDSQMFARLFVMLLRPLEHLFFFRASFFRFLSIGRQESPVDNCRNKDFSAFVVTEGSGVFGTDTAICVLDYRATVQIDIPLLDQPLYVFRTLAKDSPQALPDRGSPVRR